MTTRYERAKTQAKIELVLADIRRLEARGLGWVGAPAGITGTRLAAEDRRATPIGIALVGRAKNDDRAPRGLARRTTATFSAPRGAVEGHHVIRAV